MIKYLINTFGRAGSTELLNYLAYKNNLIAVPYDDDLPGFVFQLVEEVDNVIVHDHNNWKPINPHQWVRLHIMRKNFFDQSLSSAIANHNRQWTSFQEKKEPFVLDINEFWKRVHIGCTDNVRFFANQYIWKQNHILYFEDFINDFSQLDAFIHTDTKPLKVIDNSLSIDTTKNPVKKQDAILNYAEIKQAWNDVFGDEIVTDGFENMIETLDIILKKGKNK